MHTHDGGHDGHDSHGGSRGVGWELLDSIMLACAVVVGFMLGEMVWQMYQERRDGVRFDLTPEGAAAADRGPATVVDAEPVSEPVKPADRSVPTTGPAAVPRPPRKRTAAPAAKPEPTAE